MKSIELNPGDVAIVLRSGRLELVIPDRDDDELASYEVTVAIAFARGLHTQSPHIAALIEEMATDVHHVNQTVGIKV